MSVPVTAVSDQLQKARIERKDTGEAVECQFNPAQYTLTKSSEWKTTPTPSAKPAPKSDFIGTRPHSMGMTLFFDGWESGRDVDADLKTLLDWTNPTPDSIRKGKAHPPVLLFRWGGPPRFEAYLEQVVVTYEMFSRDGTPVRASAVVKLQELSREQAEQARTNPTSGGVAEYRTHIVAAGDTLHSVAYREYGKASYWRGLAVLNGIDDPLRIQPGVRLQIPPVAEAAAAS
jgi:LysM repeat protein